jgi:glutamyl-tRNA synthetase/nondiscriminating glutamyl-tRNA synthetase
VVALLAPSVDKLEQLPERAALIFHYDAAAAVSAPENAEVLEAPTAADVLVAFFELASTLTPTDFRALMKAVKAKSGTSGKELFHPVRVALTGSHSGPEFDKLIPILEEGSKLTLPQHVMSVGERLKAFQAAKGV